LATQTFLGGALGRFLPGKFVTSLVDWNFLIIALIVEMGIFNALAIFLQTLSIL